MFKVLKRDEREGARERENKLYWVFRGKRVGNVIDQCHGNKLGRVGERLMRMWMCMYECNRLCLRVNLPSFIAMYSAGFQLCTCKHL